MTHGRGKKAGRGAGLRGGRGNAGLLKHRFMYMTKYMPDHFGRHGFKRPQGIIKKDIIINVGDLLYLSNTEAGMVTNVRTVPARQVVGRALTGGNSALPIDMLFFPRDVLSIAITGTIEPGDWVGPDGDGNYFDNIDITALDVDSTHPTVLVNVWDDADDKKISPEEVELISNGAALRIYTNDNSVTWNYVISTGGGSVGTAGGGGGTTDHSILFNLDYASSGHTGFAPGAAAGGHGNADHSAAFALLTEVSYTSLNSNGDVGTGATQVSQGNHTHAALVDVPSGEIVLFESAVAVTGYSLLATVDDQLVYISSGGASGTKPASTWTQPNHNHPTGSHTLAVSEIPGHQHFVVNSATRTTTLTAGNSVSGNYNPGNNDNFKPNLAGVAAGANVGLSSSTGGGSSHSHGSTSGAATSSSWRPLGRNFTRQQRT